MKSTPLNRRKFLAASGVALAAVPAALQRNEARAAAAPAPFKIDCQSHLFAPELIALMEKRTTDPTVFTKDGTRYLKMGDWLRKIPPLYLDVDAKLATMDAAGIAVTALSINDPGPEWFGADGPAVAQMANDFVARGPRNLKRAPSDYLKQIWLDIVSPLPLAMKFGYEFMGADRLLFSSDHPWVEPQLISNSLRSLKLPAGDEAKIFRGNAHKLFRL
ncbi:MAG: amidohydrolase family protein [Verrucomicrobia bacterium]|nr:amidohydrolase family protein [Verrucomicrobiota bacterium]